MNACEAPIQKGPRKGQPATGSRTGVNRHYAAGELPCAACSAVAVAITRRYRNANPEAVRAQQRRYIENNREQRREWNRLSVRRYRVANLDKHRLKQARRRARKASALTLPFTANQLAQKMAFWGNRCWICGGEGDTIDHVIPIARGGPHVLANLRPACRPCNAAKGARDWRSVA